MNTRTLILNVLVYSLFVVIDGNSVSARDDLDTGYYWREYTRDIPKDALQGGIDKRGKTTYIGQTVHKGCGNETVIVTGQIREAEQKMIYEWGYRQHTAKKHVQILCSRHPEKFEWTLTNATEIVNLERDHFVSGGVEKNYSVYIGRLFTDEEVVIGKVLVTNLDYMEGFYGTSITNGTFLHIYTEFEVLGYNSNAPTKTTTSPSESHSMLQKPNSTTKAFVSINVLVFALFARFVYLLQKI